MAVNTTKNIKEVAKETSQKELEAQVEQAAKLLGSEKKVKVSLPKLLEKHVGPTVPFGINGVMIVLPVDGNEYEVPESFKQLIKDYVDNLTN